MFPCLVVLSDDRIEQREHIAGLIELEFEVMVRILGIDIGACRVIECSSGTEIKVVRICAPDYGVHHHIIEECRVYLEHSHNIELCRIELEIQFLI